MSTHKHGGRAMRTASVRTTKQHPIRKPRISFSMEATAPEKAGTDPYNTSGTFDRRKNWERVGKR